jgi:ribosomal protein S19E (S16A)
MKQMIKRKDGSVSQRGLWDNIRANKGSGKKPTAAMLKQEKKIKAKSVKKAQIGTKVSSDNTITTRRNPVAEQRAKINKAVSNFTKSGVSNKKSANDWNYSKFDYVTRKGWDDIAEGLKKRANEYDNASKQDFRRADSAKASLKKILPEKKKGGSVKKAKAGAKVAKDGKWIQKAINPKHKGYCTPMTKATCTPKRKALAMTLRKMAKKK